MKVSQKTDYALRAMIELARHAVREQPLRSGDIAERGGIPEKFLEAILVELRKAGLVRSRRGPEGGHLLARAPGQISAAQIREAIEGPLSLSGERRGRPASSLDRTLTQLWEEVERVIEEELSATSLEELVRRVDSEIEVADYSI